MPNTAFTGMVSFGWTDAHTGAKGTAPSREKQYSMRELAVTHATEHRHMHDAMTAWAEA